MKGQKNINQVKRELFEDFYIYTYQALYFHIQNLTADEEKIKQLLILTYSNFYSIVEKSLKLENAIDWLRKKADYYAEKELKISSKQITAAYSKEKEKSKEEIGSKKQGSRLDEASIFFEIKDRLGLDEDQQMKSNSSLLLIIFKILVAAAFLAVTVKIIIFGSEKVSQQLRILREPFLKSFTFNSEEDTQKNKENYVVVNNKKVYLSDIGQVLYSLPPEETEQFSLNPEIQIHDQWIYYLPCPDREDSLLAEVSPNLSHILYRTKDGQDKIEIVAREVDDYCIWNDRICVAKLGSFQTIGEEEEFEKIDPGVYIFVNNNRFYLKDLLGRSLNQDGNNYLQYADRNFVMDQDCVLDVNSVEITRKDNSYRLKNIDEERKGIFREHDGTEELYIDGEYPIDSFCLVNDWIYYSACIRKGNSSIHYSKIFRKSLINGEKPEKVSNEFPGRILEMYYCNENQHIYADYIPQKGKNDRGVIGVIALNGQISYLDDKELRSERETSGNDVLKFVMVQNNQVYCYWQDEDRENGEVLWKEALVIPNGNRIYVEH